MRLLVIEDDEPIAMLLERGLRLAGYDVVVEMDGPSGRASWLAGGFAAVILDVMLPGSNGLELCAERRAAGDGTPVLLLTARDDDAVRRQASQVGASAMLVKPFVYQVLLECLADLVARGPEAVAGTAHRLDA
jgi:two-component system, OmpR family, response regulator